MRKLTALMPALFALAAMFAVTTLTDSENTDEESEESEPDSIAEAEPAYPQLEKKKWEKTDCSGYLKHPDIDVTAALTNLNSTKNEKLSELFNEVRLDVNYEFTLSTREEPYKVRLDKGLKFPSGRDAKNIDRNRFYFLRNYRDEDMADWITNTEITLRRLDVRKGKSDTDYIRIPMFLCVSFDVGEVARTTRSDKHFVFATGLPMSRVVQPIKVN